MTPVERDVRRRPPPPLMVDTSSAAQAVGAAAFHKVVHPLHYHQAFLSRGVRADGRGLLRPRRASAGAGVVTSADGSAMVKLGQTTVLAGVRGQPALPSEAEPGRGRVIVALEIAQTCSSGGNSALRGGGAAHRHEREQARTSLVRPRRRLGSARRGSRTSNPRAARTCALCPPQAALSELLQRTASGGLVALERISAVGSAIPATLGSLRASCPGRPAEMHGSVQRVRSQQSGNAPWASPCCTFSVARPLRRSSASRRAARCGSAAAHCTCSSTTATWPTRAFSPSHAHSWTLSCPRCSSAATPPLHHRSILSTTAAPLALFHRPSPCATATNPQTPKVQLCGEESDTHLVAAGDTVPLALQRPVLGVSFGVLAGASSEAAERPKKTPAATRSRRKALAGGLSQEEVEFASSRGLLHASRGAAAPTALAVWGGGRKLRRGSAEGPDTLEC